MVYKLLRFFTKRHRPNSPILQKTSPNTIWKLTGKPQNPYDKNSGLCAFSNYLSKHMHHLCPKPKPQNWTIPLFLLCFATATSRTLIIYNSSIQISNRFASKPFLLSRPLCLYSTSWSVFRRKCIFFSISRACFGCGFHFSLSNLNWLELPSGFFCKIAIMCLHVFVLLLTAFGLVAEKMVENKCYKKTCWRFWVLRFSLMPTIKTF